jgi:hypothetical protein
MLDLSKQLEAVDGLVLFGDHERPDLVWYLPDEIDLDRTPDGAPDLSLQVFFPDDAVRDGLEDALGSILSLGVVCGLSAERRELVEAALSERLGRDDLQLVAPSWEGGSVELLLLDSQGDGTAAGDDRLVRGVVGSRRPSLQDGRLSAVFHARLDRRGTALVAAALDGSAGSLAGVLYDLQFPALRPALDLRMSADLDAVARHFQAGVGVKVYYVAAEITAGFGELRERGVIDVEVISQVADPEAERLVEQAVRDFYDVLMRELFRPTVSPAELAGPGGSGPAAQTTPVRFTFAYTETRRERKVQVDYRKRSAGRRTHNPAAHLRRLAALGGGAGRLVQRVPLSAAWREVAVEVAAPGAFDDPSLLGLEVVLWRGRDGVLAPDEARDGGLRMPAAAVALADLAFARDDLEPRRLAWVNQPQEPPFYRWQARLTYRPEAGVDSPVELWTEPHVSSSADLDLFPVVLAPRRETTLLVGAGHDDTLLGVEADLVASDPAGRVLARRRLAAKPDNPEARWTLRRGEGTPVTLEAALTFRYAGGRSLVLPGQRLVDRELVANTPFATSVRLTPVLAGPTDGLVEVTFVAGYGDPASGYRHDEVLRLRPPDFAGDGVAVPVLRPGDPVRWEAVALRPDRSTRRLGAGTSSGGVVVLEVSSERRVAVEWVGPPLADLGLRWVRVHLRARADDGSVLQARMVEWTDRAPPTPQAVLLPADGTIQWKVELRFPDGLEATAFEALQGDLLAVTP